MAKLAIIIATYNSEKTLKTCLDSCFRLIGVDYEVFVADGGSTDKTIEICSTYPKLTLICSEPDQGIYDAWNKVLSQVNVDWYCFIGSDDYFVSHDILLRVFETRSSSSNYISGNAILFQPNNPVSERVIGKPYQVNDFIKSMPAIHSGSLHHWSIVQPQRFNKEYKIAGDYDLLCRNLPNLRPEYNPQPFIYMQDGGISKTHLRRAINETYKIRQTYFNVTRMSYILMFFKTHLAKIKRTWF